MCAPNFLVCAHLMTCVRTHMRTAYKEHWPSTVATELACPEQSLYTFFYVTWMKRIIVYDIDCWADMRAFFFCC